MQHAASIDIAAPPEKVWVFLTQPDKLLSWYYLLRKAEYSSPKKGGTGSNLYCKDHFNGLTMKINYLVTKWVENKEIILKMTSINVSLIKSMEQKWT
jgi:uncharacterized protein YndB with AHSA1/START domain